MDYLSEFSLTIREMECPTAEDIVFDLRHTYPGARDALGVQGEPRNSTTWYDCAANLLAFSKQYPHHIFVLDQVNDGGFQTRTYFHNGQYQEAATTIIYEDFDAEKLKDD